MEKPSTEGLPLSHLPPHSSAVPMLIGPGGLPAHPLPLSHLPPNHPSLVTSPQTATVPPNTTSSIQGSARVFRFNLKHISHLSMIIIIVFTVQPLNLLGSTASLIPPHSASSVVHPGLHRQPSETPGLHHQLVLCDLLLNHNGCHLLVSYIFFNFCFSSSLVPFVDIRVVVRFHHRFHQHLAVIRSRRRLSVCHVVNMTDFLFHYIFLQI